MSAKEWYMETSSLQQGLFADDECGVDSRLSAEPLASRMRPRTLDECVGQEDLLGPGRALRRAIETDRLSSLILWGPPGCGKTTLARLIAETTAAHFIPLSAVTAGVADLRAAIAGARQRLTRGTRTIVFLDEIHRFNKAQQDVVLPHVEDGTITLIGATTENPSFEVNAALLSRCRVLVLKGLEAEAIATIIDGALVDPVRGLGASRPRLSPEGRARLILLSGGDARVALTLLEGAAASCVDGGDITRREVDEIAGRRSPRHDKGGDGHYDVVSALIKSVRGSDPDAALYWLARMLEGGEDPLFIARRLVLLAAEDVGLADPQALVLAVAAQQATHAIGLPECYLPLGEAAVYLALAPKSNSAYSGYKAARDEALSTLDAPVPLHLRNAPTGLMKGLGYGAEYKYAHDYDEHYVPQTYLPESLGQTHFYRPGDRGAEKSLAASFLERGVSPE